MRKLLYLSVSLLLFSLNEAQAQTNAPDYGSETQIIDDTENDAWVKINPYNGSATIYVYKKTNFPTRESVENAPVTAASIAATYDAEGNLSDVRNVTGNQRFVFSSGQWCDVGGGIQ